MILEGVRLGLTEITRIYHGGEIIFQGEVAEPFDFHVIEDGKLIIVGALSANNLPNGLYLDCVPDWEFPEQTDSVLKITQVYKATQNGSVLEVE